MSQRRRLQPTRSNTEELEKCNARMKPMPKLQTFSNGHEFTHSSAKQNTTEEHPCTDKLVPHLQIKHRVNEKSYSDNPQQQTRSDTICQTKMLKSQSSAEFCPVLSCPDQFQTEKLVVRNGLHDGPGASGMSVLQSGYLNAQRCHVIDRSPSKSMTCSPHERQSLDKLFLDLELVEISKVDEDSASDLSDSERLPIPPSPLTPPELNLRAEEISPGYFSHDVHAKGKDYDYPDFLPPPYSSWNLSEVSTFLNKERKNTPQAAPSAFQERYVDRLRQLEWLQLQTVQAEKAKMNKSRPQTASGLCRNGKYLGKSKSWHSPSPSKPINSDNLFKMACAQDKSSRRKYASRQHSDLTCSCKSPTKVSASMNVPTSMFRPSPDMRVATKKTSVMNSQQNKEFGSSSKMFSTGNLRPPKQSSVYTPSAPKQTRSSKLKKMNGQSMAVSDADYSRAKRNGKPSQSPSYKMK